jgi:uncharacterized protein (DUF1778 family)
MSTTAKKERLEARIPTALKKLLQHAADLQGRTVTDFVVTSAHDAAQRIIEEHSILALSSRDREMFISTLLSPPEPSERLVRAAERYRRLTEPAEARPRAPRPSGRTRVAAPARA